ncbi:hypothetical protein HQ531_03805 [bacterium]|nr:hypothetical protein [bacterium]
MNQRLSVCTTALLFLLNSVVFAQLPVSKQATLIESVSSAEVMIEATGIYNGSGKRDSQKKKDVKKNGMSKAALDAKKSAVYFVLFGGTDPLLSSEEERQKFGEHEAFFFNNDNISNYISYEDLAVIKKVKIDGGKGLKVVKRFKVNKGLLTKDLESRNVVAARADLAETIGNPFIMVLPAVKKGESPVELLRTNLQLKHAAAVIESYLTARQYDVVVPEQQESMDALNTAQMELGDREEDYAYQLALSVGSDIYIEYSGAVEDAGYGTKKYALVVRAYETTTARLLGTETGYSQGRKGEIMVSIEEAMNDAIENVLSRITNYWKTDVEKGIQYKLIFNLSTDFDEDQVEEIQFAIMDAIESISSSSKENIVTKQTVDYLIWCDPQKYDKSSKVYRAVKKYFSNEETEGALRKINVNRKMILLKVDSE